MGRVVIITGASKGIGAAITDILLKDKETSILAIARSDRPLTNLKIKYGEERVATITGDLADPALPEQIIKYAIRQYGKIDSIIANAGVLDPVDKIEKADITSWKKLFDVNFFSTVELVSLALPHLKKTKGNVVLVSSGASTKGYYGWGAYGASKAALNHFATQLASEEKEIRVVSVAPGVVDTGMQEDIRNKFGKNMTPEALKRFTDLKQNHELLEPAIPATIYANLALKGIKENINGKYLRYDDDLLKEYSA